MLVRAGLTFGVEPDSAGLLLLLWAVAGERGVTPNMTDTETPRCSFTCSSAVCVMLVLPVVLLLLLLLLLFVEDSVVSST